MDPENSFGEMPLSPPITGQIHVGDSSSPVKFICADALLDIMLVIPT